MVPLLEYPLGKTYNQVMDILEQAIHESESHHNSRDYILFTESGNNYIYPFKETPPEDTTDKCFHIWTPPYSSKAGKTIYITSYGFDHKIELAIHYIPKDYNKEHPWGHEDYTPVHHVFIKDPNSWSSLYEVIKHFHNKPILMGDPVVFHDFCMGVYMPHIKRM